MTRNHQNKWQFTAVAAAIGAMAQNGDAALFGFTPVNDLLWRDIAGGFMQAFSPVDVMLVAILVHARRRRALQ